jgi:hypothetical protein
MDFDLRTSAILSDLVSSVKAIRFGNDDKSVHETLLSQISEILIINGLDDTISIVESVLSPDEIRDVLSSFSDDTVDNHVVLKHLDFRDRVIKQVSCSYHF